MPQNETTDDGLPTVAEVRGILKDYPAASTENTTELIECLRECSEDLACELDARYPSRQDYPIEMQRWQRDMAPVFRARKLLEKHDAR